MILLETHSSLAVQTDTFQCETNLLAFTETKRSCQRRRDQCMVCQLLDPIDR